MSKIKYVINPFTGEFDAINKPVANEVCASEWLIGNTIEWTMPNGAHLYSANLIGDFGTLNVNGVPITYPNVIGQGEICLGIPAGLYPSSQTPRLIATFDTDLVTAVGDFVYVAGDNYVLKITTNDISQMPNGVFGVAYNLPEANKVEVIFVGILDVYSGLTIGQPVFLDTSGIPTHVPPSTGMSHQVGIAIGPNEIFFNFMQPMRRS